MLDSLLFVANLMLEQLVLRAATRALALASVRIQLALDGGATHTRTVQPALPTNDRPLWIKLLRLDLEAHPPQSAILAITLTAVPGKTSDVQLGLFSPQLPEPFRLDVTLARIRAIVGETHVGRAVLKDTHEPDAFRMEPFALCATQTSERLSHNVRPALRRFRSAVAIYLTLDGAQPKAFFFRERRYTVERAYGPWVSCGDWWNPSLWEWEQWDLVARASDNTVLCCCISREPQCGHWRMMALYD
jgi:protein ImuB